MGPRAIIGRRRRSRETRHLPHPRLRPRRPRRSDPGTRTSRIRLRGELLFAYCVVLIGDCPPFTPLLPRPDASSTPAPLTRQFLGQAPRALTGPSQRRHRIAAGGRFYQGLEHRHQLRIFIRQTFASCATPTHTPRPRSFLCPPLRLFAQFAPANPNGALRQPGRLGHGRDPSVSQPHRFGGLPPTPCALIQFRSQQLVFFPNGLYNALRYHEHNHKETAP